MSALILLALESTLRESFTVTGVVAAVSTFTLVESVVVVESVFESLHAAKIDATANANNTFFIFRVLIINYCSFILNLIKGNPFIYTNFGSFLGYFSLIIVLIIAL